MNEPRRLSLVLILLAGILAVSTASIFIRLAQAEGVPSLVIAAYRLTLASLALAPLALTRYRSALRALTRRGGSHTGDLMVAREPGGMCPKDGAPLLRRTVGGRTTYSCPLHQR